MSVCDEKLMCIHDYIFDLFSVQYHQHNDFTDWGILFYPDWCLWWSIRVKWCDLSLHLNTSTRIWCWWCKAVRSYCLWCSFACALVIYGVISGLRRMIIFVLNKLPVTCHVNHSQSPLIAAIINSSWWSQIKSSTFLCNPVATNVFCSKCVHILVTIWCIFIILLAVTFTKYMEI